MKKFWKQRVMLVLLCSSISLMLFAQEYPTKVTVSQDGTGDFISIQEAINSIKAFPDEPIQIFIKEGVYREKVHVYSWNTNLSIVGDAKGKTIITWDDHFKKMALGRNSTFHTYTLKVEANDFYASNLTIENTAGDIGQALAVFVEADRVMFENCELLGNQDTMYLTGENSRQYFKNCLITGTTDFIFGNATVLFDDCEVRSKKASFITAASTTKESEFGFVFNQCKLTSESLAAGTTYLGRPWRKFAKTAFINCELGAHIHKEGWKEWNADGSAYYVEYNNTGLGADITQRVDWSRQLSAEEVSQFTMVQVFNGWNGRPN